MPFRKPEPVSFKIIVCGEVREGLILLQQLENFGCCFKNHHPTTAKYSEFVKVAINLQNVHVTLEFSVALLKDATNAPISSYVRSADLILLVIQDVHDIPGAAEIIHHEDAKVVLTATTNIEERGAVIKEVKRQGYDAFAIFDSMSNVNVKNLIDVIKHCLVISGKRPIMSLKQELEKIDVRTDKTNVRNTTFCYERNSIG